MLVSLAVTIAGLLAFTSLAVVSVRLYLDYAGLQQAADAAALAATSRFTRNATPEFILDGVDQSLSGNGITDLNSVTVETCYFRFDGATETDYPPYGSAGNPGGSGDSQLCTNPPRKLIRVSVSQALPALTVSSLAEAPSLDMVLVIDQSESMAWFQAPPNESLQIPKDVNGDYPLSRDPSYCNQFDDQAHACHPFYEVKQAAQDFIDYYIYYPYDRVAVVTFAKHATIYNPVNGTPIPTPADLATTPALTNNITDLDATLSNLKVTEGARACDHDYDGTVGSYGGPGFPNGFDVWNLSWFLDPVNHPLPWTWTAAGEDEVPCRLYDVITPDGWPSDDPAEQHISATEKFFKSFSCPQGLISQDYSRCWTSNIGEGLAYAAAVFSNTPDPHPASQRMTVLLTDGNANSAYYGTNLDNPYCPAAERDRHPMPGGTYSPYCRDTNTLVRHCLPASPNYDCIDQNYGKPGDGGQAKFYWPAGWYTSYPATTTFIPNTVDLNQYDADDYARDQADALADGQHSTIFAIGLGQGVVSDGSDYVSPGTPPAGLALLHYIAQKGGTGSFYQVPNDVDQLIAIFQAIAAQSNPRPSVADFAADPLAPKIIPIRVFSAVNQANASGFLISTSATVPAADDPGWSSSIPTIYTVPSAGSYTLYPWVKDAAGHISTVYASPVTVRVDTGTATFTAVPTTPSPLVVDEFDTPALDPAWEWYVPSAGPTYSLTAVPGSLQLVTPPDYDHWSDVDTSPQLRRRDMGSQDFSIETHIAVDPSNGNSGWHSVLMVGFDASDQLWLGADSEGSLRITRSGQGDIDSTPAAYPLTLRIDKHGSSYSFEYKPDGGSWATLGNSYSVDTPVAYVGLLERSFYTAAGNAVFDVSYFRMERNAADPTATRTPVVPTSTLPPATATATDVPILPSTQTSTPTPTPTPTPTGMPTRVQVVQTFVSAGAYDGWVLESRPISNVGGTLNAGATTLALGDDTGKRQYRAILSFNTSGLPDTPDITGITLRVRKQAITGGGNPLSFFQGFMVDVRKGPFGTSALQAGDFQAAASRSLGPFMPAPNSSGWYTLDLLAAKASINTLTAGSGMTQIRLRFKLGDNNNAVANILSLYSGNGPAANRPQLIITYFVR